MFRKGWSVIRATGAVVCSLASVGCVQGPVVPQKKQAMEPVVTVAPTAPAGAGPAQIDKRPQADKIREFHSLSIFSCDYGISTVAELPGNPVGPTTLANEMAAVAGDPWRGHTVEVEHYATYLNQKRVLKNGTRAANPGLLPGLLLETGEDCPETKMHGGYYTNAEVINDIPPLIVEIVVKIDGKVYRERSVYSPAMYVHPKLRNPTDAGQIAQAMAKANRALVARLPKPTPVSPAASSQAPDDEGFINM